MADTDAIERLIRAYTAEMDALMDCHTNIEGEWWADEQWAEGEYDRGCALIDEARREMEGLRKAAALDAELDKVHGEFEAMRKGLRTMGKHHLLPGAGG